MLYLGVHGPRGRSVWDRRNFLRASLVTAGSLSLPALWHAQAAARTARRETAVIQLWLGGGPSHLDMYDLKPQAPAEIRGAFRPIATNVPGVHICELLTRQARRMDKLAIVRSLRHTSDDHLAGTHWMQTGQLGPTVGVSVEPTRPAIGSVTARVRGPNRPGMLPYVHIAPDPMGLPFFLRSHEAAYLGGQYAPLLVESARARPDPQRLTLDNLIGKVQFTTPCLELVPDVSARRFGDRATLNRRLDEARRRAEDNPALSRWGSHQHRALDLVTSGAARAAFDLESEEPRVRDRYGRNAWGQGLLLCRRLVEAGVTFVTLNTDSFSGQWDNHRNLPRDFQSMLPVYDQMLTALIDDLVDRGLYDHVVLLVWGEFGRTPRINGDAGRDHWGRSAFALLGGGGLRGGVVVGSTNPRGEDPRDRPLWPTDVLATVYHVLGIDPSHEFADAAGRPLPILAAAEPIRELV